MCRTSFTWLNVAEHGEKTLSEWSFIPVTGLIIALMTTNFQNGLLILAWKLKLDSPLDFDVMSSIELNF